MFPICLFVCPAIVGYIFGRRFRNRVIKKKELACIRQVRGYRQQEVAMVVVSYHTQVAPPSDSVGRRAPESGHMHHVQVLE